jgi:hypothetical protein
MRRFRQLCQTQASQSAGAWVACHPRWIFHFTPTSAWWLNAVETFFSKMTRQRIRRGVFRSIADLQAEINAYLAEHNASPKPFEWTQSAETILAKLDRCPVPSVRFSARDANGEPDVGSDCKRRAASAPCKPCTHDSTSPRLDGTVDIWAKNAQYLIPAGWTKLAEWTIVVGEQQRPEPGPRLVPDRSS